MFESIIGYESIKAELSTIIGWYADPDIDRSIRLPRGVLLTGAPGLGKTLFMRAVAEAAPLPVYPFVHDGERDVMSSLVISNCVTSIGNDAFGNCTGIESVTIPDSVTDLGNWVFADCIGLTSVTIGNGVTGIGYGAFSDCTGLTSITIPDSVTSIGTYAFKNCNGLTSITIPDGVTSIDEKAFYGWKTAQTIYCRAESQPSGWNDDWNYRCKAPILWGANG